MQYYYYYFYSSSSTVRAHTVVSDFVVSVLLGADGPVQSIIARIAFAIRSCDSTVKAAGTMWTTWIISNDTRPASDSFPTSRAFTHSQPIYHHFGAGTIFRAIFGAAYVGMATISTPSDITELTREVADSTSYGKQVTTGTQWWWVVWAVVFGFPFSSILAWAKP